MSHDFAQLVNAIQCRTATSSRWGIGTVMQYIKSCEPFLPESLLKSNEWQLALKNAESLLSWCDEGMGDAELIRKSVSEGTDVPARFCATVDGVLTSSRQDRDGDILMSKGMIVDPNMPLLWQHIPVQPTGRLLKTLDHTEQCIKVKWGIVDTAFGRDNAILCKAGCLRFSHGFKPHKFEPISQKGPNDGTPAGWKVLEGEIREGSLVSIPSNVDAVVTAFSQGKLSTPLVKSWAKQFYDARPLVVPVTIDLRVKTDGGVQVDGVQVARIPNAKSASKRNQDDDELDSDETDDSDSGSAARKSRKLAADKSGATENSTMTTSTSNTGLAEKGSVANATAGTTTAAKCCGAIEGSYEAISEKLSNSALDYLRDHNVAADRDGYAWVQATFADSAIIRVRGTDDVYHSYKVGWKQGDDGPEWDGEPAEVEIRPTVVEKAIADAGLVAKASPSGGMMLVAMTKEGRTLSADTHGKLTEARKLMRASHDIIHDLLETNSQGSNGADSGKLSSPDDNASAHMPKTDPDNPANTPSGKSAATSGFITVASLSSSAIAKAFEMADGEIAVKELQSAVDGMTKAVEIIKGQQLADVLGG